ncbi:hypothetical protein [Dyella kyungheensis]|uniref:Uncharacterized protein n=1 Tax=Dyella kyungheensis TaxID=1242174 RepID=A0ABS2K014_9GAMM|nr:hypothetical protein [Dyella kyungheensis]MBM7123668.1 hypothetical protein [Dyella kyungheensis]
MSELARKISEKVELGAFAEALQLARVSTSGRMLDPAVRQAMLDLTAELRSICMGMASRKKDFVPEYDAIENVLRQANELTGQDMYGQYTRQEPKSMDEAQKWNAELDAVLRSVGVVDRSFCLRLLDSYTYGTASSVGWVEAKMKVLLVRVRQGKHLSVFDLKIGKPMLAHREAELRGWIEEYFPGLNL